MVVEQRVIGQKIGARPAAPAAAAERVADVAAAEAAPKKSRKRLVVILLAVVVLAAAGAGWYVFLGPGHATGTAAAPKPTPTPVAGQVLTVGPVSVNLADGHYLRLGLAIQLSDAVKQTPNASRALDLAIALYSGRTVDEVSAPATREQLKAQLLTQLRQAYGEGVMDVYLTDYVTQ